MLKGFARMSKEKRTKIASIGGIAAHKAGNAHEWNSKEAKLAGSKGGKWKRK